MELHSYIRALCDKGEGTEIEFKSSKGGFSQSMWESYSAFANTNGGIIVLGIKEKDAKFFSDNLTQEAVIKYKKQFWDGINNKTTVSASILQDDDVVEVEYEGSWLLVIKVPRAEYSVRPIYLTLNPFGGHAYRRRHEGDYKISDDVVRRLMGDSLVAECPLDRTIFPYFALGEELDINTLAQYRRLFNAKNENHPWSDLSDMDFLKKIGAYGKDPESGEEGFTRAGVLMFGTQKGLDDAIPYYFIDYREKLSDDPAIRWTDRVYIDGYWEPNLFQFFGRIYPKIRQALPVPFKLDGIMRIDDTPAHKALREAIINCLVHACYGMMNNIVIERYPDKLIFVNPGTMLISVDQFFAGGTSICRNFVLQKMFSFIGYVERAGSGADTITKGWKENNWPKPQIREIFDPDRVEMVLSLDSLEAHVRTCDDISDDTKGDTNRLSHRQEIIYRMLSSDDTKGDTNVLALSSTVIAKELGVSAITIKRELAKMAKIGVIKHVGPSYGGHWEINDK